MDLIAESSRDAALFRGFLGRRVAKSAQAIASQPRPRGAFLEGWFGCGKTTLSKLMLLLLMCLKPVEKEPCGECSSCRSIQENWERGGGCCPERFLRSPFPNVPEGFLRLDCTSLSLERFEVILRNDLGLQSYQRPRLSWQDSLERFVPSVVIFDEAHLADPAILKRLLRVLEMTTLPATVILCAAFEKRNNIDDALRYRLPYLCLKSPSESDLLPWSQRYAERGGVVFEGVDVLPLLISLADRIPRRILNELGRLSDQDGSISRASLLEALPGDGRED